ncbi:MAG: DUF1499 domain-containing protein [Emcibacteraceae bacterium]|nr:DUF1499 domain-containing protein [Emcibacteraceae bacterium]
MQEKRKKILLKGIFVLSLLGTLPLFSGLGTKLGLWQPMTGFMLTRNYMIPASVSALVALFIIFSYFTKDYKKTILPYILALVFAYSGYLFGVNQEPTDWTGLRGIHDVTTDMENPPEFIALLNAPGRKNSFEYTIETAERQQAKFPWVKPILTNLSPDEAYARALFIAKELNWQIAQENPEAGRFEATDYTKWFNFNDDIVVRITAYEGGSRVDLRSLSRVGGSDHGLGAIRIMKFHKKFTAN